MNELRGYSSLFFSRLSFFLLLILLLLLLRLSSRYEGISAKIG